MPKIQNDRSTFMDSGKAVAISFVWISLQLLTSWISLCDCLKDRLGVDGAVLIWISLYLTNCKQKKLIIGQFSEVFLLFGVPQGLFCLTS